MQGNELRKKKKKVSTKKTSKISKKLSPRASDTGKGSCKHNAPDLWDRGSISILIAAGKTGEPSLRFLHFSAHHR